MALGDLYDKQATLAAAQTSASDLIRQLIRQLLAAHYTGRNDVITSDSDINADALKAAVDAVTTAVAEVYAEMNASLPLRYEHRIDTILASDVLTLVLTPLLVSGAGGYDVGRNGFGISDTAAVTLQ